MTKSTLFSILLLLLVAANHEASSNTFLSRRRYREKPAAVTTRSMSAVIDVPRGGKLERVAKTKPPSDGKEHQLGALISTCCQNAKDFVKRESKRPSEAASAALVRSIFLFAGAILLVYSMNVIQNYYFTDADFWLGSPWGRRGAYDLCKEGKSVLFAFPLTISEAISSQDQVTAVVIDSYLTFSALMFLVSRIGNPSVFPISSGHWMTVFNTLRVLVPFIAAFFIPRFPTIALQNTKGKMIIHDRHTLFAVVGFLLSPLFEFVSATLELIQFFRKRPWGDKFIPVSSYDDETREESTKAVDNFYKSLWLVATLARALIAPSIIFLLVKFDRASANAPDSTAVVDACGVLQTIQTFVLERAVIGLLGGMFVSLALAQMCESSGRRITCLLYILPLLVVGSKETWKHLYDAVMAFNVKKNYLALLNFQESGKFPLFQLDRIDAFMKRRPDYDGADLTKCTALLDIDSVPDNCFNPAPNPTN